MFVRFVRDRQGASAAEFALIAPVFLTLLFGIFQFGWALHCASSVRYALEESARSVLIDVDFTAGEVESQMRTKLADLAEADIQIQITHDDSLVGTDLVHLNSTYVHPVEVPFIPAFEVIFNQTTSIARPT